jgi:hypothetical protein
MKRRRLSSGASAFIFFLVSALLIILILVVVEINNIKLPKFEIEEPEKTKKGKRNGYSN